MKLKMKNQGNVLYLLGYLAYIVSQPETARPYIWLIGLALAFFAAALLIPLFQKWIKTKEKGPRLASFAEATGGLLTLFFALTFIPKARFIETHLALFGLLVLTFLATRNILPGLVRKPIEPLGGDIKHPGHRYAGE